MNILKLFKLFSLAIFTTQILVADIPQNELQKIEFNHEKLVEIQTDAMAKRHCNFFKRRSCKNSCQLGTAGFSVTDSSLWYEIVTLPYPTSVPLSLNRNRGSTQGNVSLLSDGLKIGQPGNYSVSFTAILLNNNQQYTPLIPVFLIKNGIFDPTDTTILGAVGGLPPGLPVTIQGTGILENVTAGTTLSLVATNGGSPQPEPVTVISWGISLFKIPCESQNNLSHSSSH